MLSAGLVYTLYRAVRLAFNLYIFSDLTDPFLAKIEQYMPQALLAPLNFSPIVAFLILSVAESIILRLLLLLM